MKKCLHPKLSLLDDLQDFNVCPDCKKSVSIEELEEHSLKMTRHKVLVYLWAEMAKHHISRLPSNYSRQGRRRAQPQIH